MPPRGLPGNANLEQLKKGAKSFQRAVRAGDAGAAEVVREFHPRLPDAQPGSPELNGFTRTDAQLVVARQFAFSSWPKLKAHLELIARYARSPTTSRSAVRWPTSGRSSTSSCDSPASPTATITPTGYGARSHFCTSTSGLRARASIRSPRPARSTRPANCWIATHPSPPWWVARTAGSRCST